MRRSRRYLITALTLLCLILISLGAAHVLAGRERERKIKIGFLYVGDTATPYTANFVRAERALKSTWGDQVEIIALSNVFEKNAETALCSLAKQGCELIFTTSFGYGETAKKMAGEYPDIQFCQATCSNANEEPLYDNYHTFMGEIYEGRYISGVIAGMKLRELLSTRAVDQPLVGYVAAYPYAEVISGYTAFFLGVRSVVPTATMKVKYTNTWTEYATEHQLAQELIDEGCVIISQHSDTIGPAVACEAARTSGKVVYHVGYNQSMTDVAPTTSLISCRINWNPYILGAAEAVMKNKKIEEVVPGHVHGNDMGGGFDLDWVQLLEVNDVIASTGSSWTAQQLIEKFREGTVNVFQGDYVGVDPYNPKDTINLKKGFAENAETSAPQFHYVLRDVIEIE